MYLQLCAEERSEAATPRRLQQARDRGHVLRSPEVAVAFGLLATFVALQLAGPWVWHQLDVLARQIWGGFSGFDWTSGAVHGLALTVALTVALVTAPPLLAALAAGLLAGYLQVGFLFTTQPLHPDWHRLSPLAGFQRLFSRRSLVELAKVLVKLILIAYLAYTGLSSARAELPALLSSSPGQLLAEVGRLVSTVVWRVGIALLLLAALDYFYQRYEYQTAQRMSRREVKTELRETEGSPEVRQRIRRLQREVSRRQMIAAVPRADVVITNPTHYAVALRYEQGRMDAPTVVAKGQGWLAQRIRALAGEHSVPVVEDPPLARSLYQTVAVGDAVPPELYQAVAEILAHVYRLRGRV